MDRRHFLATTAALSALGFSRTAAAQIAGNAFIISGFPAGGMGDQVSRPMAERLRGKYASNVLVESKVGAGGRIAIEHVKRAAPDGLTVLQIPSSPMVLYPHIYKKLNYDTLADFVPVTTPASYSLSVTAGPAVPANVRTIADFMAWAKANPRQASYGVPAAGSSSHFVGMLLSRAAGVELQAVPYKGGAPMMSDVVGGQIPITVGVMAEVLPHVAAGRLRSLGVSSAERSPFLPQVPTLVEQGFKDIAVTEWLGWFVPARTPQDQVQRLASLVREGLQQPDYQASLTKAGLVPSWRSPEDFAALVRADLAKWVPLVKATGFSAEE
ncbi:Bug family tripartite tricarboxylate transporter substrate binding protein [Ramlibacter sp. AW1]|uniref:Bug family tripartite tricarboxylate transporter substrate binding protein n=1 Tax=Ramlibacter aurantiacus TaxID=2801330 RepID=A0A936ZS27_9BURK|nr:Bug family tripartite tricarboxylate transporter substrate binding protein [Ramlibacter aurantiacus]MBL0420060.1 Bug family tripartite tricarboxylate transporter substrate binding protein [Ramlibacter aurantiacus]